MSNLSPDEIIPSLTPHARQVMLDLLLYWARYDAFVSQWIILAYGMTVDSGSLLLGNMDTRQKLDRLKSLYEHHDMKTAAGRVEGLIKEHKDKVWIRNHIAHSICAGHLKKAPNMIVFATMKAKKKSIGFLGVHEISLQDMRTTVAYGKHITRKLNEFCKQLTGPPSKPPPEPPAFL